MTFRLARPAFLALVAAALAAGCADTRPAAPGYVVSTLQPTRGSSAAGTVWLTQEGPQVFLRGRITGLVPDQEHGFHVHEKGDCTSGDGMSAGGHLNPAGKPHGPPGGERHAGDLPSVKADASGTATVRMRVTGTLLSGAAGDVAGKALIVHASPDDYTTQPTGNSGARIACGVVGSAAGRDASGNVIAIPSDL
jgi:Cu-Zn family superoxide dismutase